MQPCCTTCKQAEEAYKEHMGALKSQPIKFEVTCNDVLMRKKDHEAAYQQIYDLPAAHWPVLPDGGLYLQDTQLISGHTSEPCMVLKDTEPQVSGQRT